MNFSKLNRITHRDLGYLIAGLTIFIDGGYIQINTVSGKGMVERISKRPLFYQINFLHYNPGKWWKYFSDIYCAVVPLFIPF
jgi:uncharacterized protein